MLKGQITLSKNRSFQNYKCYLKTKTCFFLFFINTANIDDQRSNSFLYNTFSVSTDPRTLNRCYLQVGNGNEYPDIHYKPNDDLSRVYRDVMSYIYANNDYQGGPLLKTCNFETLFLFVYFDLKK